MSCCQRGMREQRNERVREGRRGKKGGGREGVRGEGMRRDKGEGNVGILRWSLVMGK